MNRGTATQRNIFQKRLENWRLTVLLRRKNEKMERSCESKGVKMWLSLPVIKQVASKQILYV